MYDFQKTMAAAQSAKPLPQRSNGGGSRRLSVSVVNNKNGKRVQLSDALVKTLGIQNAVAFLPLSDLHQTLIARELPMEAAIKCTMQKQRTVYNINVVNAMTEAMLLDYSGGHTSRSLTHIALEDLDGVPVAVVCADSAEGEAVSA